MVDSFTEVGEAYIDVIRITESLEIGFYNLDGIVGRVVADYYATQILARDYDFGVAHNSCPVVAKLAGLDSLQIIPEDSLGRLLIIFHLE